MSCRRALGAKHRERICSLGLQIAAADGSYAYWTDIQGMHQQGLQFKCGKTVPKGELGWFNALVRYGCVRKRIARGDIVLFNTRRGTVARSLLHTACRRSDAHEDLVGFASEVRKRGVADIGSS